MNPLQIARFWSHVNKTAECWLWTGTLTSAGYGNVRLGGRAGRNVLAHRIAYAIVKGPVSPSLQLDHLCRTRACVNPDHLEPVTHRENDLRGAGVSATNAVKTHCLRGHELTPENVKVYRRPPNGSFRVCLLCRQIRDSRRSVKTKIYSEQVPVR